MTDFYNSLKNKQIQEYLNENKERSSLIADQVRRAVQRFEGVVEPEATEQLNQLEIRNSVSTVSDFKIKLQTKLNTFQSAQQNTDFKTPAYSTLFHTIGNYVSDLVDYNKAAALCLNPSNTSATRKTILEQLKSTYPIFEKLSALCQQILNNYMAIADRADREEVIRLYFAKVMVIYSLYNLIIKQFRQNTYSVIAENDLLKNIPFLPQRFLDVLKEFNLKPDSTG